MVLANPAPVAVDADALLDRAGTGAHAAVVDLMRRRRLAVPSVVVFEALREAGNDRDRVERVLRGARIYPLHEQAARRAAELHAELKREGRTLHERDTLIAGTCLAFGLSLLTRNVRHFGRVRGLRLLAP